MGVRRPRVGKVLDPWRIPNHLHMLVSPTASAIKAAHLSNVQIKFTPELQSQVQDMAEALPSARHGGNLISFLSEIDTWQPSFLNSSIRHANGKIIFAKSVTNSLLTSALIAFKKKRQQQSYQWLPFNQFPEHRNNLIKKTFYDANKISEVKNAESVRNQNTRKT